MRFRVLVEGEHAEGLEARERFERVCDLFRGSLAANGFLGTLEATLDYQGPVLRSDPSFVRAIFEEKAPPTSAEVLGEVAFAKVKPLAEIAAEFVPLPPAEEVFAEPMSDAALRAAIRREKKVIGGNKILSQAELAERLGVSRYRIRKVLG